MELFSFSQYDKYPIQKPGIILALTKSQGAITATSLCCAISHDLLAGGKQELLKSIFSSDFQPVCHENF